jgi:hypothetical protein
MAVNLKQANLSSATFPADDAEFSRQIFELGNRQEQMTRDKMSNSGQSRDVLDFWVLNPSCTEEQRLAVSGRAHIDETGEEEGEEDGRPARGGPGGKKTQTWLCIVSPLWGPLASLWAASPQ